MRLFVALDIPAEVRERLAALVARLRSTAPARWTRVEGLHVTLKFVGESPPEKAEQIRNALSAVHPGKIVEMSFRGVGFFPNERRPRVFWAGIEANDALAVLAAEVDERLVPLGIPAESRPFHPHLTLARFDTPDGASALLRALEPLGAVEFGGARCSEFYLYRSRLLPGGAQYERLASYRFAEMAS
jgi:RNA 2',3'-cyclic 3'-phosphodiesterase